MEGSDAELNDMVANFDNEMRIRSQVRDFCTKYIM